MRHLTETDVAPWVLDTLLSPTRSRPIVAITSHPHSDRGWIDAAELERALGDHADVVFLATGEATWALSEALPPRLDVYGGAVRIWWPGLLRDSDPYAHRLHFVASPTEAERVFHLLVAAVRNHAGLPPAARAPAPAPVARDGPPIVPRRVAPTEPPERVRVTAITPGRVEVASATHHGTVLETDLPPGLFADAAQVGCELLAQPLRPQGDGTWAFSTRGLLPDPWQRFVAELKPGDVVVGRVQNVLAKKNLVFVDMLPGVVGVCHVSELDYGFVADITQFARPGQLLAFEILQIVDAAMSLQLSRKRAHGQTPRPLPSLVEGGVPFVWKEGMPLFENLRQVRRDAAGSGEPTPLRTVAGRVPSGRDVVDPARAEQVEALEGELAAANDERQNLVAQIRTLRAQAQEAKKELRAAEDRHAASERRGAGEQDPLASERAFLLGVRLWHARQFDEDDRLLRPLQRMHVHREFLASVRATAGIDVDKVLEVCAQVACGFAHTLPGREVHPLRAGSRGADSRTRKRDGAQAWRCALQVKTPSARRLHWWNVPGPDGATIEFACIGLHDSFDIPE